MPTKFSVHWSAYTTSTARKTCAKVVVAAAKAAEIIEFNLTGSGVTAAADTQHEGGLVGATAGGAGTGVSATPIPALQGGAAAASTVLVTMTTEPTTYTTMYNVFFGFNQRGGMRWAVPRGEGFTFQSIDTNPVAGITVISAAAGAVSGGLNWWENV